MDARVVFESELALVNWYVGGGFGCCRRCSWCSAFLCPVSIWVHLAPFLAYSWFIHNKWPRVHQQLWFLSGSAVLLLPLLHLHAFARRWRAANIDPINIIQYIYMSFADCCQGSPRHICALKWSGSLLIERASTAPKLVNQMWLSLHEPFPTQMPVQYAGTPLLLNAGEHSLCSHCTAVFPLNLSVREERGTGNVVVPLIDHPVPQHYRHAAGQKLQR